MPKPSALKYALKLLGYRALTERKLREKLQSKRYQPEDIKAVVEKLAIAGLVDDQKFAADYVRDKLSINRRGSRRIYFELIKHGVAKETAYRATNSVNQDEELAVAQALLQSRQRQWVNLEPLTKKRRAIGLLSRRGFPSRMVRELTKEFN